MMLLSTEISHYTELHYSHNATLKSYITLLSKKKKKNNNNNNKIKNYI